MSSTTVYTLLSHNCSLLTAQLLALRTYTRDLSRIVVVQGPVGLDPNLSAGNKRLSAIDAEVLGVELLEVNKQVGGLPFTSRLAAIYNQICQHAITQPERFAVMLHSDVFPINQYDVRALLFDHTIAGRGAWKDEQLRIWPTWLAIDTEAKDAQDFFLDNYGIRGIVQCKLWPACNVTSDNKTIPKNVRQPACELLKWEWCAPVWLHLNQVILCDQDTLDIKLANAAAVCGLEFKTCNICEEVTDLPVYKPRIIGPRKLTAAVMEKPQGSAIKKYANAVQAWAKAGYPERTDEEVAFIYEQLCKSCEQFGEDRCKACGCRISGAETGLSGLLKHFGARALLNKVRMATEHCPRQKW